MTLAALAPYPYGLGQRLPAQRHGRGEGRPEPMIRAVIWPYSALETGIVDQFVGDVVAEEVFREPGIHRRRAVNAPRPR